VIAAAEATVLGGAPACAEPVVRNPSDIKIKRENLRGFMMFDFSRLAWTPKLYAAPKPIGSALHWTLD